jgi:TonB family protein
MVPGMEANLEEKQNRERLVLFLVLSLLFHGLLLYWLYHSPLVSETVPDNTVFVDLDKLPPVKPMAPEQEKMRQIVNSETASPARPKDADYLGEKDQSVDQQTKARNVDIFRKGGAMSKAGSGGKPQMTLKDLAPPSSKPVAAPTQAEIDGMRDMQKKELARQEHNAGGEQSADNPGSADNDYLKDVKDGDRTLLNTKEFVYFSYYKRIRERLEVAWNSRLRSTLEGYVYGGRKLANDKNYVTALLVVLDANGKITAVKVLGASGTRELDDAAIGAFNEAGPFPDPPAGLVKDGKIEIRWDFILQS